jgi:hypothetical protein
MSRHGRSPRRAAHVLVMMYRPQTAGRAGRMPRSVLGDRLGADVEKLGRPAGPGRPSGCADKERG